MSRSAFDLSPDTRQRWFQLQEGARLAGAPVVLVSTLRTHAEQHALWLIGRPEHGGSAGAIVTNADAYHSWHETGRAFDVAFFLSPSGKLTYDGPWDDLAAIAANYGLEWGGSWKTLGDRDHFQYVPAGLTLAEAMTEQDRRLGVA
jgi:peptidoglycan L-alanyl-D-glutamate endopeptidase CwlK